jgi:hypothetical protein
MVIVIIPILCLNSQRAPAELFETSTKPGMEGTAGFRENDKESREEDTREPEYDDVYKRALGHSLSSSTLSSQSSAISSVGDRRTVNVASGARMPTRATQTE